MQFKDKQVTLKVCRVFKDYKDFRVLQFKDKQVTLKVCRVFKD